MLHLAGCTGCASELLTVESCLAASHFLHDLEVGVPVISQVCSKNLPANRTVAADLTLSRALYSQVELQLTVCDSGYTEPAQTSYLCELVIA